MELSLGPRASQSAWRFGCLADVRLLRKPQLFQSFWRVLADDRFVAFGIGKLAKVADRRDRVFWSEKSPARRLDDFAAGVEIETRKRAFLAFFTGRKRLATLLQGAVNAHALDQVKARRPAGGKAPSENGLIEFERARHVLRFDGEIVRTAWGVDR